MPENEQFCPLPIEKTNALINPIEKENDAAAHKKLAADKMPKTNRLYFTIKTPALSECLSVWRGMLANGNDRYTLLEAANMAS